MGKTFRKVDERTKKWCTSDSRHDRMMLKGVKTYNHAKLGSACTDAEGNFKRNTWDDVSSKAHSTLNRDIRNTAKVQIDRQLKEMVDV